MQNALLTVCIRSYNQVNYISEALDSVLMQHTTFPFEIIVSDDCSKDGSVEILQKYGNKYPGIIRLILGCTNVGGPDNLKRVIEASEAKYLAFLDGDDYYTDTYKLQKQVDFLESHEDYVACFHNVLNVSENKSIKPSLFLPLDFPQHHDCTSVIANDWFLPIHSIVLRREYISFPSWYNQVMNDDLVMNLSVVMHGPYWYMPDTMAVYRHHENNISNQYVNQILIDTQLCTILQGFKDIYPEQYRPVFNKRISFYQERIAFTKREKQQPWRKYFRAKTYRHIAKQMLHRALHI